MAEMESRKATKKQQEIFDDIVSKECWSIFEGCRCGLLRNHKGLHVCCVEETDRTPACGCTWTDAQEKAFMDEIKTKYNKK